MPLKSIAIFPIKVKSLIKEEVYFAKAFSLFIHMSLENILYSSEIIYLMTNNKIPIPEYIYTSYSFEELLKKYKDGNGDASYVLFMDIINKKNSYIITYYLYKLSTKILIKKNSYLFNKKLFEKTYKLMISDILKMMELNPYIYNFYITNFTILEKIKNIIKNDSNFFYEESGIDTIKYIEELTRIYIQHHEISILKHIIKKLLTSKNIFFVNKIIDELKVSASNDGYTLLLLSRTLITFKQFKKSLDFLNLIKEDSTFFKLNPEIINTLKAKIYLKLNNLTSARKYIMKAMKYKLRTDSTYELFLEIMFKSNFFRVFKLYINIESYDIVLQNSRKACYWAAKYYSEILNNNKKALSIIEDFKFHNSIIFLYIKILYRISFIENNYNQLSSYITKISSLDINNDDSHNIKIFINIFTYLNQISRKREGKILDFSKKEEIELTPYEEIELKCKNIEEIIFNYIYNNPMLSKYTIKKLLFFILKDNKRGLLYLQDEKSLYYYIYGIINKNKRSKLLKKSFNISHSIDVLNRIIIHFSSKGSIYYTKKFLKKRIKYIGEDEFSNFYNIKLLIVSKNYKKALEVINSSNSNLDNISLLKGVIYFKLKEYDKMSEIMNKYNNLILKDSYFSYINAILLLKIKNNRKGLFYLQNSYNLNPNKTLQKQLIKEYKRYGINYSQEL